VGGAIGGLAVLALFVFALFYCLRRSKLQAPKDTESSNVAPFTTPIFAAATTTASAASSSQANLAGPSMSTTTTGFNHSQTFTPASAAGSGSDQRRSPEQVPLLRNVGHVAVPAAGPFGDNKVAMRNQHQQQTPEVAADAGSADADADEPPQYER
jgi:hypothetical protein